MKQTYNLKLIIVSIVTMLSIGFAKAQTTASPSPLDTLKKPAADTVKKAPEAPKTTLTFGLDLRTRFEWRDGYKSIPTADTSSAFFINQRTRFNIDYKSKGLDVFLSLQDARVWGQQDPREGQTGVSTSTSNTVSSSTTAPLYLFEAYAEPHFGDKFSIRIGRQRIIYDNQRLFAENDWRLPGNSHDAVRLIYNNKINFTTELLGAFNQSAENTFTTRYSPLVPNYKNLVVNYLNWKLTDKFTLTTINTMDGFQSSNPARYNTTFERFTSGGRLEFTSYHWYLTFSGYYQYGKDSVGKKLGSYYYQPEIRYTGGPLIVRLGLEYLSGSDSSTHPSKNKNFVPLYGVAHRFMGNIDLFATFPSDVNGAGLVNPYLFFQYIKDKISLRIENHLFYSQSQFVYKGADQKKYLGFENDWRFNYKPGKITDLEIGFCWASITKSMTLIKRSGDDKQTPLFAYVSLRLTPTLGKITF